MPDSQMNVISIQSHVAYGHVGNSAAVFALQRLGVDVWPVHTVQFSNHTGYPDWQGQAFGADHIAAVIDGLAARGLGFVTVSELIGWPRWDRRRLRLVAA